MARIRHRKKADALPKLAIETPFMGKVDLDGPDPCAKCDWGCIQTRDPELRAWLFNHFDCPRLCN